MFSSVVNDRYVVRMTKGRESLLIRHKNGIFRTAARVARARLVSEFSVYPMSRSNALHVPKNQGLHAWNSRPENTHPPRPHSDAGHVLSSRPTYDDNNFWASGAVNDRRHGARKKKKAARRTKGNPERHGHADQ